MREGLPHPNRGALPQGPNRGPQPAASKTVGPQPRYQEEMKLAFCLKEYEGGFFPNLASRGGTAGELLDLCFETQSRGLAEKM